MSHPPLDTSAPVDRGYSVRVVLTRRSLLGAMAAAAAAGCDASRLGDRQSRGIRKGTARIGLLSSGTAVAPDEPPFAAFREGMRVEGFEEGQDYDIAYRFGVFDPDLMLRWAKEFVADDVQVIMASTTGATQAARAATSSVPIVMIASHDPIDAGVVKDLVRPGGNVTGHSLTGGDLMPLQLDYLQQITPVRLLAYLSPSFPGYGPSYPSVTDAFERRMRATAATFGIDVLAPRIQSTADVAPALATLASEPIDAVFLIESPTWFVAGTRRPIDQVVDFAARRGIPSFGSNRLYAQNGVLATYGDARSYVELHRTAATYVGGILRGTRPGDLAIDKPTRLELVVNAKTASAMRREIPPSVLRRASVIP